MNFGVTVLLIISGWAFLSIVVSLGFGGIAKTRDRATNARWWVPASDETERETPRTAARRTA
jgi:hypothetical protein